MENRNTNRFFSKKTVTVIIVGCCLVLLYVLLQNLGAVGAVLSRIGTILNPFFWGIALAYILNLLLKFVEGRLFRFIKRPKLRRGVSVFVTVILALLIIVGFLFALIPQLISSIGLLLQNLDGYLDSTLASLSGLAERLGLGSDFIENTLGNWDSIGTTLLNWAKDKLPDILRYSMQIGRGLVVFFMGFIVAIYILCDKERLMRHVSLIFRALFSKKHYDKLYDIAMRSHRAFGGFLAGKTLDSFIIGVLCFIFMLITDMPYSLLISTIIGVTNIIPTFGPIIGGVPCTLIIMIVDPIQGLWFGLFIIILQQFDGNILGPFILSDTVGLSALWILVAVVVCGALFGVVGMVIGVPLFAVVYDLVSDYIKKRLVKKGVAKSGSPGEPGEGDDLLLDGGSQAALQKVKKPALFSRKKKDAGPNSPTVTLDLEEMDKNIRSVEEMPLFNSFKRKPRNAASEPQKSDSSAEPQPPAGESGPAPKQKPKKGSPRDEDKPS